MPTFRKVETPSGRTQLMRVEEFNLSAPIIVEAWYPHVLSRRGFGTKGGWLKWAQERRAEGAHVFVNHRPLAKVEKDYFGYEGEKNPSTRRPRFKFGDHVELHYEGDLPGLVKVVHDRGDSLEVEIPWGHPEDPDPSLVFTHIEGSRWRDSSGHEAEIVREQPIKRKGKNPKRKTKNPSMREIMAKALK